MQTFINKFLRRILHLKWSDKVSKTTLWETNKQLPVANEIKKRKLRWIGHTHTEETSHKHHTSEQCGIATSKGNQLLRMTRRNITYKGNIANYTCLKCNSVASFRIPYTSMETIS